jgi:XTP/dITP diphosphohydrolase
MRPRLVLATLNRVKALELIAMLADVPFEVVCLSDVVPGAALPPEDEDTYTGNALLKARTGRKLTSALTLGDDSGLEVDALDGAPGLHSARFGGPGLDDAGRCRLLLEALRGVPDDRRTARFRCVIALAHPEGSERLVEGIAEGRILTEPRGASGFGYDPLFYFPPLGRSFAELSDPEKAEVSHRGRALREVRRVLSGCYTPVLGT